MKSMGKVIVVNAVYSCCLKFEVSGLSERNDVEKVLSLVRRDEVVQTAVDLGNINAPTGHEKNMADFLFDWLEKNGFQPVKQEVAPERYNIVTTLKGTGGGQSIMLNSHMDTDLYEPEDYWTVGEYKTVYNRAWLEGDSVMGRSIFNARGPMTATLIAAKAIKESGINLRGDLMLAMVVGEIGMAPVDEFQGPRYFGKGLGTMYLVNHGVVADYVLVAERTAFAITWTEAGVAYFKITVRGNGGIYTPYITRPTSIEKNPNAVVRMSKVIQVLEEWAYDYERKNVYEFSGGTVIPKVNIGAIRGGLPYKPSKTVGVCSIYVDVRLPPGKGPLEVKRALRELLSRAKIDGEIQMYLFRRGYEGQNVSRLVRSVEKAHERVLGGKPGRIDVPTTSMWRDLNVFNAAGIPSVTYGPGASKFYEGISVDELIATSKLYAAVTLDICNEQ